METGWRVLLLGGALALSAYAGPVQAAAAVPVLDVDFPDPFVLPTPNGLYAYATNSGGAPAGANVQLSRSQDGHTWSLPVEAMPTVPPWAHAADPSIWAPEVLAVGGRHVLYFSARHATRWRADGRTLCIGAAVALRPEGPFVPQPEPLTCGGAHGVIDASPFRDGESLWLFFKGDGNCCAAPTPFMAQRLSSDGLSLAGTARAIAGIGLDLPWEGHVVEAPQMVRMHGRYRLFYAANDYGSRAYATGYADCQGPLGPCLDAPENPILASDAPGRELVGPGHQTVFEYAGATWIAYHAWRPGRLGARRYRPMYIDRIDWSSGRPVVRPR